MRAKWLLLSILFLRGSSAADLRWAAFPAAAYLTETGVIVGGLAQVVRPGDSLRHESQAAAWLTVSSRRQLEVGLRPEWWPGRGDWVLQGELGYQHWPATWYGPTEPPAERDYTVERFKLEGSLRRRVAGRAFVGGYLLHVRESFTLWDEGFPHVDEEGPQTGLGLEAILDSRDGSVWPTRGAWLMGRGARFGAWAANRVHYSSWLLDGRAYHDVAGGVLAGQAILEGRTGEPGFRFRPRPGDYLRAYGDLRYTTRWLAAGRLEWRRMVDPAFLAGTKLERRLGLVVFAEAGSPAKEVDDLGRSWKPSLGLGGRFALLPEQHVNLRADLAFGHDGPAVRIKLGEEF